MLRSTTADGAERGSSASSPSFLAARDVAHRYDDVEVLRAASLTVHRGEAVAIMGSSGCGKSTLLAILSGLLEPSAGQVLLDGEDIGRLPDAARRRIRLAHFGFVFQFGDLIPELRVAENIELPARLLGASSSEARQRALSTLDELGVAVHANRRVGELSGGELQRVAVARAIVHEPAFVFADEPTGSLDERNSATVLRLLTEAVQTAGAGLVLVTHDSGTASVADRTVSLRAGQVLG